MTEPIARIGPQTAPQSPPHPMTTPRAQMAWHLVVTHVAKWGVGYGMTGKNIVNDSLDMTDHFLSSLSPSSTLEST